MSTWIIDPDHSVGTFFIRHMMIAFVHGQLNGVSGTIFFDPADLTSLSADIEINVSSIITGITKRDDHLRSQDFFHAEKYPAISFRSTGTERTGFSTCTVRGDLTIRGITRPAAIDVTVSGPVKSPFGETSIGLSGTTMLNREDFGMMWNEPMENHGLMVARDVAIGVNMEADLAED